MHGTKPDVNTSGFAVILVTEDTRKDLITTSETDALK
jgi:hypothetical protein